MRELKLVHLSKIIETEEHDVVNAKKLARSIMASGMWTVPIAIEHSTYGIMDGHHRFNAAKLLNFKRVPCVLMDYKKSGITLRSWRSSWNINIDDIFILINNKNKFPLKTTKHVFNPSIKEIKVPVSLLL